jgi:hypothetical protein
MMSHAYGDGLGVGAAPPQSLLWGTHPINTMSIPHGPPLIMTGGRSTSPLASIVAAYEYLKRQQRPDS